MSISAKIRTQAVIRDSKVFFKATFEQDGQRYTKTHICRYSAKTGLMARLFAEEVVSRADLTERERDRVGSWNYYLSLK